MPKIKDDERAASETTEAVEEVAPGVARVSKQELRAAAERIAARRAELFARLAQ